MASTYEPIASFALTGNANVDFTSIPQTYSDLVIVTYAKCALEFDTSLYLRFNSDTGSNYSITRLRGDGSAATSSRGANTTLASVGRLNPVSGDFSLKIVNVFGYSNSNIYKTILSVDENAASRVERNVALWRDTSAITTIRVGSFINNMALGSTISLYGIKAA